MLRPAATKQFRRDRRLAAKRWKDLVKLDDIMTQLAVEDPLPTRHRPHPLGGPWDGHWECHIEPDWLLLWYVTDTDIVFVRTGTHADLFG